MPDSVKTLKYLSLSEAQKAGRLQDFIEQQQGLDLGPVSPAVVAALKAGGLADFGLKASPVAVYANLGLTYTAARAFDWLYVHTGLYREF